MTTPDQDGLPFPKRLNTSSSQPKTMTDLLSLPDQERKLMNWLMRCRKANFAEVVERLGTDLGTAQEIVNQLLQTGFISMSEESQNPEDIILKPKIVSRR
jgi:predicted transcriptional regulator